MALDSWLTKVKSAVTSHTSKKPHVGILASEIATLMSKLTHLWRSLSDSSISHLHNSAISLEGVRKIISDDDTFLLSLACAELTDTLRSVADSLSSLTDRSSDPLLRGFRKSFIHFANTSHDPNHWVMTCKEMESKIKKMEKYISSTTTLYKELDQLSESEHGLRRLLQQNYSGKISAVADAQQKIFWQRQEVKHLKQASLWSFTTDAAALHLARTAFTVLARIKHVFIGVGHDDACSSPLPRSLSASAAVYPSTDTLMTVMLSERKWFFETSRAMLSPPETTLGAAALALQYANVVMTIEKMIRAPRAVGPDARDNLYGMLPARMRGVLRERLRGMGWAAARDAGLAAEWRAAMARILGWLGPVAQNTVRWQAEGSFERRRSAAAAATARGSHVLLLQTLYFASREKVEAAVAELLVGLNYVWRFEMAMSAEVFLQLRTTSGYPNKCSELVS